MFRAEGTVEDAKPRAQVDDKVMQSAQRGAVLAAGVMHPVG